MDRLKQVFIENPEQNYHVRELARLLKKSPTTISNKLKALAKERILIFRNERGHFLYKANTENQEYKQIKISYNIDNLRKSGLIDFLVEEYNHPESIILFGSYAKGENNQNSDIDLAVLTPNKKETNLSKFEKKLKHNIQLFTFSKEDILNLNKKNKELLNNIINGIIIYGFLEIFKWNLKTL